MSSRKTLDYDCKTRFTEAEYAAIKQAAAILDMSESALLRKLVLDSLFGVARTLPLQKTNTSVISA